MKEIRSLLSGVLITLIVMGIACNIARAEEVEMMSLSIQRGVAGIPIGSMNLEYSHEGAEYGFYSDEELRDLITTVSITGYSSLNGGVEVELENRDYWIKELKSSKGYVKDETIYFSRDSFYNSYGNNYSFKVSVTPIKGVIKVAQSSIYREVVNNNPLYSLQNFAYYITTENIPFGGALMCGFNMDFYIDKDGFCYEEFDWGIGNDWKIWRRPYKPDELEWSDIEGYRISDDYKPITFSVNEGETTKLELEPLEPYVARIDLNAKKVDTETRKPLANAEFIVEYYSAYEVDIGSDLSVRQWRFKSDENGDVFLNKEYFVGGDSLYLDTENNVIFPLGTLNIYESKAPEGYEMDEKFSIFFSITKENIDLNNGILTLDIGEVSNTALKKAETEEGVKPLMEMNTMPEPTIETNLNTLTKSTAKLMKRHIPNSEKLKRKEKVNIETKEEIENVKTGDTNNLLLYIFLQIFCIVVVVAVILKRKKLKKSLGNIW